MPLRGRGSLIPASLALFSLLLLAGCGAARRRRPWSPARRHHGFRRRPGAPGANTAGGATVEGSAQAEALQDQPFTLNLDQPVPPDFRAAYQRKALIAVAFFKEGEDPLYPQGLEVDDFVNGDLSELQSQYPEVEFFSYDISEPGEAETSEELQQGQYGTLAAQMDVGFTPFVAMLAPSGEQYTITNLYQGYVERGVLDQALFDLTSVEVASNTSDTDVELETVELTESGGGVEYFTVTNDGDDRVNLQGFSLRVVDPESGEVTTDSPGVEVNEQTRVGPGRSASVGRVPDAVDADGRQVRGTFEGGEDLELQPGDTVALLDGGGAVVDTVAV
ncbi:hypothetical protein GBA65_11120 [Rubrobacter marinus]|uniref:LTD domain-containing protein n=1 Tax=Rubrobacter marinus TaxID=2653852 RepID=A0A6G8PXM5_9ACTN|nr:lamin tail domain-containing protein [Rubrobacter marinus]QIN78982.1 hypothetical protein GBA65_11120 [Rubrobacter marinus]